MDDTIKAVARAMAIADGHDPNRVVAPENDDPKAPVLMVAIPLWYRYRDKARAHVAALEAAGYAIVRRDSLRQELSSLMADERGNPGSPDIADHIIDTLAAAPKPIP